MRARSITAAVLMLGTVCGAVHGIRKVFTFRHTDPSVLTYAHYRSLEAGMRAREIIDKFGPPPHVLERDGKIRGLTYRCENAAGSKTRLRMAFDEGEGLVASALDDEGVVAPEKLAPAEASAKSAAAPPKGPPAGSPG
ncbi:MAG: hypothetical protein ACE5JG_05945 [Planctomycetota bacterium]